MLVWLRFAALKLLREPSALGYLIEFGGAKAKGEELEYRICSLLRGCDPIT
jgi:hypothetical protein